jgi:hypothetical protein
MTKGSNIFVNDVFDNVSSDTNISLKKPSKELIKPNAYNSVIFESVDDGIAITDNCRFWIYVIINDQWDSILKNIDNDMMHLGANIGKSISANDIILFYIKATKGKINGFVAIGQICSNMEKNMEGIKVFNDKNLNRYITLINSISIFERPCKIGEFNDLIIKSSDVKIKGSAHFSALMLKGECVFTEITIKKLGIALVKKLFELTNIIVEKEVMCEKQCKSNTGSDWPQDFDSCDDSHIKNEFSNSQKITNNTKTNVLKIKKQFQKALSDQESIIDSVNNISDDEKSEASKKSKTKKQEPINGKQIVIKGCGKDKKIVRQELISDNEESDIDDNVSDFSSADDNEIEGNIPVMFIICQKLRKVLLKLNDPLNKVKSVLDHYKFCNKCDITNNNSRELYMTLNRIDHLTIKFVDNRYNNALNAYLSIETFPKHVSTEYIKMYHMLDSEHYQGDVLIEYTSKVEPIINVVEEKIQVKGKKEKPYGNSKPVSIGKTKKNK